MIYVWTPSFQSQKLPLLFSDLHNTQQTSTCDPKLTKRSTWYQIRVSFTQGKLGQSPSSNPHKEAQKAPKWRQVSDHLQQIEGMKHLKSLDVTSMESQLNFKKSGICSIVVIHEKPGDVIYRPPQKHQKRNGISCSISSVIGVLSFGNHRNQVLKVSCFHHLACYLLFFLIMREFWPLLCIKKTFLTFISWEETFLVGLAVV